MSFGDSATLGPMTHASIPVVNLPVELTDDTVVAFESTMAEYVAASGPGIVLDLEGVSFISSAGLGCLVKIGMRLDGKGRRLALARPDAQIERSLRMIGLESKLPMFPDVSAATHHVATRRG